MHVHVNCKTFIGMGTFLQERYCTGNGDGEDSGGEFTDVSVHVQQCV